MKIHYVKPFSSGIECRIATHIDHNNDITSDYRGVDCIKCISAMNPGEQAWHDKNNQERIDHKSKDKRRRA